MKYSIFLIAGEVSGDMYGAKIVEKIKTINPEIHFCGLGGKRMKEAGVNLIEHTDKLSVMGIPDVIKKIFFFKKLLYTTIDQINKVQPKAIILIDYPGFNLRLAKKIKKKSIPVYYYIPPKVWAWKKKRIKDIKKYIDEVFYIFPFEEHIYKELNIKSEYVGNPLIELISCTDKNSDKIINWRKQKKVALLPGSRQQEIRYILPSLLTLIEKYDVDTSFIIASPNNSISKQIQKYLNDYPKNLENVSIVESQTLEVLKQADAAIITSGTATLEAALLNVPHFLIYKTNWVTYLFAKVFVNLKFYGLVNLLLSRNVSAEVIQYNVNTRRLTVELDRLFNFQVTEKMKRDFESIKNLLGSKITSEIIANKIVKLNPSD